MRNFYRSVTHKQPDVWFFAERGVMSHAMSKFSERTAQLLLTKSENGNQQSLGDVVGTGHEDDELILLTEFGLGNNGFGSPDAGLFMQRRDQGIFVFIESKMEEISSSWQFPREMTKAQLSTMARGAIDDICRKNSLNSAINGQLEMRWRFINAFLNSQSRADLLVRESQAVLPEILRSSDRFYWQRNLQVQDSIDTEWRRVSLKGGLKPLQRLLERTSTFFLLALTADSTRPEKLNELRLYENGSRLSPQQVATKVFWGDIHLSLIHI